MALPDWEAIGARLEALNAGRSASECHGILCGLLAVHAADARHRFARLSIEADAPPELLGTLYDETLRQMDDDGLDFHLLLPDDDADLAGRTRALAEWCDGFVYGLGAAGRNVDDLPEQSAEFLRDVMNIARADADAASGDGDEAAMVELIEYVRVGAMLTRTECGTKKADH
ncbi:MAG: UPF0149 family protein [Halofilum sp. (in: g-proteobacteria)]|nr:UPF0149 family protein [Halofilum sp. (in: g-proteobacteria)]